MKLLHLSDFRVMEDQPGLFGQRLTGTIIINSPDGKEIIDRINVINTLKENFQASIMALDKNIDKRFEIFRDALPSVSK
ncbi:DNA replication terminus site-binding protein [Rheinheimera sp. MMS21-TC3]|uniref:DNA replication terminus site-binding protein n=1 Tax=Rheinheimera sp. MMS21-TC3 TaxID=3072790 RepID=UPI0028C4DD8C|nr:DNA replication terminus site-binding protein [Rheinheimera sp. MMS21-TC3]WNO61033.1 DNA replication terminus site-binding protein [Rheinheimera sp. MMS21-TC3]